METLLKPEREITEVEHSVLEDIFGVFLSQLEQVWISPSPLKARIASSHGNPERVSLLESSESVVSFVGELRIESEVGVLAFAMPAGALAVSHTESTVPRPPAGLPDSGRQEQMLQLLSSASLQLEVRLQAIAIPLRNLMDLREGDVLTFTSHMDHLLDGVVGGKPMFRGRLISSGNKAVFQIDSCVNPAPPAAAGPLPRPG